MGMGVSLITANGLQLGQFSEKARVVGYSKIEPLPPPVDGLSASYPGQSNPARGAFLKAVGAGSGLVGETILLQRNFIRSSTHMIEPSMKHLQHNWFCPVRKSFITVSQLFF